MPTTFSYYYDAKKLNEILYPPQEEIFWSDDLEHSPEYYTPEIIHQYQDAIKFLSPTFKNGIAAKLLKNIQNNPTYALVKLESILHEQTNKLKNDLQRIAHDIILDNNLDKDISPDFIDHLERRENVYIQIKNLNEIISSLSDNEPIRKHYLLARYIQTLINSQMIRNLPSINNEADGNKIILVLTEILKKNQKVITEKRRSQLSHHALLKQLFHLVLKNKDYLHALFFANSRRDEIMAPTKANIWSDLFYHMDFFSEKYTGVFSFRNDLTQIFQNKILAVAAYLPREEEKHTELYDLSITEAIKEIKNSPFFYLEQLDAFLVMKINSLQHLGHIKDITFTVLPYISQELRAINNIAKFSDETHFEFTEKYRELNKKLFNLESYLNQVKNITPNSFFSKLEEAITSAKEKTNEVMYYTQNERAFRVVKTVDPTYLYEMDEVPANAHYAIALKHMNENKRIPQTCAALLKILFQIEETTVLNILNRFNEGRHLGNPTLLQMTLFEHLVDFLAERTPDDVFQSHLERLIKKNSVFSPLLLKLGSEIISHTFKNSWPWQTQWWTRLKYGFYGLWTPITRTEYNIIPFWNLSWLFKSPFSDVTSIPKQKIDNAVSEQLEAIMSATFTPAHYKKDLKVSLNEEEIKMLQGFIQVEEENRIPFLKNNNLYNKFESAAKAIAARQAASYFRGKDPTISNQKIIQLTNTIIEAFQNDTQWHYYAITNLAVIAHERHFPGSDHPLDKIDANESGQSSSNENISDTLIASSSSTATVLPDYVESTHTKNRRDSHSQLLADTPPAFSGGSPSVTRSH